MESNTPTKHSGIIGAIAGDCFGAVYEFHPVKSEDFDLYKAPRFTYEITCQKSVPESIICYLEADTMACIAGGIAAATKGMEVPSEISSDIYNKVLDDNLREIYDGFSHSILRTFCGE